MFSRRLAGVLAAVLFSVGLPAWAATIVGTVQSDGKPVTGALVTVATADGLVSQTVYSDASGAYRLSTNLDGKLTIRARAPMLADMTSRIAVPRSDAELRQSFKMKPLVTPQEISDSLPASAHFARIKFPTTMQQQQFQTDCLSCHQIGNPLTRRGPRSAEEWEAFTKMMLRYTGYPTDAKLKEYAGALEKAFDGTPTPAPRPVTVDPESLTARIVEWKLPDAQIAHDTEFNPNDGLFYTTDQAIDHFYVTDPRTNKTTTVAIADNGVPVGGNFTENNLAVPFDLAVAHGVHSLQLGSDGLFYTTGAISGEIGVFDPVKHTYKSYRLGGTHLYPHTLRIDARGIVWFSIHMSDQIGRFDPKTGKTTIIDLPKDMQMPDDRNTATYGVDVNPVDGSVWYSKLWANKIGRIDPDTFELVEYEPPVKGPRRIRFDDKGGLWVPGFGDGKISRLDTRTMKFEVWQIPSLGEGQVEAPYSLAVDPQTQDVWITANQSDRLFRFNYATEHFTAFPLPTRGAYFRDMIFTGDGRVCGSSNPMPPMPDVIEGGMDSVVCLDPSGKL